MDEQQIQNKLADFRAYCKENHLNVTFQRLAIYRILLEANKSLKPEQVYNRLHDIYPNISLATIYKTLDVLTEHNLIRKVNDIFQINTYDINLDPHHYMVCRECKQMFDVPQDEVQTPVLSNQLQKQYFIDEITIFFRGVCADCQKKESQ
jgi:Fe2+ or Zn2+ uptake regulation protein